MLLIINKLFLSFQTWSIRANTINE